MAGKCPLLTIVLVSMLAACGGALVEPQIVHAVAGSALRVTPTIAWNRLPRAALSSRPVEAWTRDGPMLNEIAYYGGIEDGKALFREVDKRDRPLPRFRASMLPQEVAELLEASYRIATGSPMFAIKEIVPVFFAGRPGFRFDYDFVLTDDVKRKGRATGAIIDGRLYLITYEAPTLYYFHRDLAEYGRIVASARFG